SRQVAGTIGGLAGRVRPAAVGLRLGRLAAENGSRIILERLRGRGREPDDHAAGGVGRGSGVIACKLYRRLLPFAVPEIVDPGLFQLADILVAIVGLGSIIPAVLHAVADEVQERLPVA